MTEWYDIDMNPDPDHSHVPTEDQMICQMALWADELARLGYTPDEIAELTGFNNISKPGDASE